MALQEEAREEQSCICGLASQEEACENGHDEVLEALVAAGANLMGEDGVDIAACLCECVAGWQSMSVYAHNLTARVHRITEIGPNLWSPSRAKCPIVRAYWGQAYPVDPSDARCKQTFSVTCQQCGVLGVHLCLSDAMTNVTPCTVGRPSTETRILSWLPNRVRYPIHVK
jgi:hypothetical protein